MKPVDSCAQRGTCFPWGYRLLHRALFRLDVYEYTKIETEANNFAASLIMPTDLVKKAWGTFENVQECARIFNVSVSAMSIRLEKLNLIIYK